MGRPLLFHFIRTIDGARPPSAHGPGSIEVRTVARIGLGKSIEAGARAVVTPVGLGESEPAAAAFSPPLTLLLSRASTRLCLGVCAYVLIEPDD